MSNNGYVEIDAEDLTKIPNDDIKNIFISLVFEDGYTLRKVIEMIHTLGLPSIKFIMADGGMLMVSYNTDKSILITIDIDITRLTMYKYKGINNGNHNLKTIIYTYDVSKLNDIFKKIKKNKGIKFYKNYGDNNLSYQYFDDMTSYMNNTGCTIQHIADSTIDNIIYAEYNIIPNCVITTNKFKSTLDKTINKDIKTTHITSIYIYDKGLMLLQPVSNTDCYNSPFGELDNSVSSMTSSTLKSNSVEHYGLSNGIIKSLKCLETVNPHGVIRFYSGKDKPLKIVSSIGDYGTVNIYLSKKK